MRIRNRSWRGYCINCGDAARCLCPYCVRAIVISALLSNLVAAAVRWLFS